MRPNVGFLDQFFRLILALCFFATAFAVSNNVPLMGGFIVVGLILVATAFFAFCPLYVLFHINTTDRLAH